jgi:plastocyanin
MPIRSMAHGAPRATLAVLPALVLILAACGSSGTSQAPGSEAPGSEAPGGGTSVTMSGLAFKVAEITIPVGNLTFINQDAVTHVIAEGENGVEVADPRVQKVSINGGSQGDLVFTAAGDYHITCLVHPTMNMEVHVQ